METRAWCDVYAVTDKAGMENERQLSTLSCLTKSWKHPRKLCGSSKKTNEILLHMTHNFFQHEVVETKSIRGLQEELAMLTQARPPGDTAHSCHETSVSSACPQPASRLSQGWQHSSRPLWSLQCPPLTMMGHRVRAKWTFHIIQGGSSGIALTLSSCLGVLIKGLSLVFDAFSFV